MSDLKGLRVVVAGAGAVGSVLALQLVRRGAEVMLADPAMAGDNASGVAAGMLAPLFESLLDPVCADLYPLLNAARDAWPAVLEGLPVSLNRSGAMLRLPGSGDAAPLLEKAESLGVAARLLDKDEALALAPGLQPGAFLYSGQDWRLDPRSVLPALHDAFESLGGRRLTATAGGLRDGRVGFVEADDWAADVLILATGPADGGSGAPLTPIKGQILRFNGLGPFSGPVVRGQGVYVVPHAGGAIVGATMEEGRRDLDIDPEAVARLRAAAADLFPALAEAPFTAAAGIRMATSDGLPLVGPGPQPGVMLARGARRNGWLLAPLMAEAIVDRLLDRPLGRAARAFDPARFS